MRWFLLRGHFSLTVVNGNDAIFGPVGRESGVETVSDVGDDDVELSVEVVAVDPTEVASSFGCLWINGVVTQLVLSTIWAGIFLLYTTEGSSLGLRVDVETMSVGAVGASAIALRTA